jgi:hypothetical protein
MDRIDGESIGLRSSAFSDVLVGCQAPERLQAPGEVVGIDEVLQVLSELAVVLVVVALDRGLFDAAIHALDLPLVQG